MSDLQLDLFGRPERVPCARNEPLSIELCPDFIARIRAELQSTLAQVRASSAFPWPDLTRTTLAEMRFHSIAGWLPEDESAPLRAAFDAEMTRLYEIFDGERKA